MKIFVDFDNTIFDTRNNFLDAFFGVFYHFGVSREVFDRTLLHFSETTLQTGDCYQPLEYIRIIKEMTGKKIKEEIFSMEMNKFLKELKGFVFEDFYKFANDFDKKDLIILSYGDNNFQKQKIEGSGVGQFFDDVIITQGDKTREIEMYMKNFPDESAMIIDDKLGYFENIKKSKLDIKTIHILRNQNKCTDNRNCDFDIDNLKDISGII